MASAAAPAAPPPAGPSPSSTGDATLPPEPPTDQPSDPGPAAKPATVSNGDESAQPEHSPPPPPMNPNLPVCANCKTQTTPLWRRAENGTTLCNACSLYQKMKGTPRPVSLKTDVIKHRNRSKGENSRKSNKAALATSTGSGAQQQQQQQPQHHQQQYYGGDDYAGRSHSRGTSHSKTRESVGQKSAPGGADEADYWTDDGAEYKRARHGFYGPGYSHSPSRQARGSSRGRGSRSSSQQRRSDSSESRGGYSGGADGAPSSGPLPPHLIPYPIFYYPQAAGSALNGQPYAYPYPAPPPPAEWAAYLQQMHAQGMVPPPPPGYMPHPMLAPQSAYMSNGSTESESRAPYRTQPQYPSVGRSQSLDGFGRDAERGRSPKVLPPLPGFAPTAGFDGSRSTGSAALGGAGGPPSALASSTGPYHPYMRSAPMYVRSAAAISDARTTPPRDTRVRRASDAGRPTSATSTSSAGSQEGRFAVSPGLGPTAVSRPPDAMTIDEVDESPDFDGEGALDANAPSMAGPMRGASSYERRGRSSTRKPTSGVPHDVDERLEKMRMESPPLNSVPLPSMTGVAMMSAGQPTRAADGGPASLAAAAPKPSSPRGPVDEVTALRLRVSELEFINGILQTRIGELEKQSQPVKPV